MLERRELFPNVIELNFQRDADWDAAFIWFTVSRTGCCWTSVTRTLSTN